MVTVVFDQVLAELVVIAMVFVLIPLMITAALIVIITRRKHRW